jgi:APA family basic amino acid/polyamine antiporter
MPTPQEHSSTDAPQDGGGLKRTLGLGHCIFFGVGSILGAGIYTLIGKVAGHAEGMTWLAFLIASLTAGLTAFAYAELNGMFPRSGGEYVYARQAFGDRVGAALGWVIASNGIISASTVALGLAGYFTQLIQVPLLPVAFGAIVLFFLVNAIGIRGSSTVNIVLTVVELAGLVAVAIAAWPSLGDADLLQMPEAGYNGLFFAAALSFYAYIGFEEIVKLAEETKEPERTIPRALLAANIIVLVVYVGIAILLVGAMPGAELAEQEAPLAAVVEGRWGRTGVVLLSIAALFSTGNTLLSNMLGSSRVLFDMGRDIKLIRWLGHASPKRRTPLRALALILVVCLAFAAIGDIEEVARIATITIFTTFLFVNLALITLRYTDPERERPFRVPGSIGRMPVISVLAILFTLVLLGYAVAAVVEGAG